MSAAEEKTDCENYILIPGGVKSTQDKYFNIQLKIILRKIYDASRHNNGQYNGQLYSSCKDSTPKFIEEVINGITFFKAKWSSEESPEIIFSKDERDHLEDLSNNGKITIKIGEDEEKQYITFLPIYFGKIPSQDEIDEYCETHEFTIPLSTQNNNKKQIVSQFNIEINDIATTKNRIASCVYKALGAKHKIYTNFINLHSGNVYITASPEITDALVNYEGDIMFNNTKFSKIPLKFTYTDQTWETPNQNVGNRGNMPSDQLSFGYQRNQGDGGHIINPSASMNAFPPVSAPMNAIEPISASMKERETSIIPNRKELVKHLLLEVLTKPKDPEGNFLVGSGHTVTDRKSVV